ncbi:MAG TPA: hypothetical protein VE890_15750, partial [Thermoguttaceae bacterium]|nr:hypothetical protein [Thermoguttaceae bacterium]
MDGTSIAGREFPTPFAFSRRLPTCLGWLGWLLIVVGVIGSESVDAQLVDNGLTGSPAVTAESIEALRKQAAESVDLDADTKQRIETICLQSLDELKRITEVGARAEQFRRDTNDIQERVGALRQRLDQLHGVQPSLPTNLSLSELEQEVSTREVD